MKKFVASLMALVIVLSIAGIGLASVSPRGNSRPTSIIPLPYDAYGNILEYTYTRYAFTPNSSRLYAKMSVDGAEPTTAFTISLYRWNDDLYLSSRTYPAGNYYGEVKMWVGLIPSTTIYAYITKTNPQDQAYFSVTFDKNPL